MLMNIAFGIILALTAIRSKPTSTSNGVSTNSSNSSTSVSSSYYSSSQPSYSSSYSDTYYPIGPEAKLNQEPDTLVSSTHVLNPYGSTSTTSSKSSSVYVSSNDSPYTSTKTYSSMYS